MPLYTYIAIYEGASYITQRRRSNYQGFGDWIEALPPALKKKANQANSFLSCGRGLGRGFSLSGGGNGGEACLPVNLST